jgi:hypothetical protein
MRLLKAPANLTPMVTGVDVQGRAGGDPAQVAYDEAHPPGTRMKNPFLSLWLSAANRIAGTARAAVTGEAKRQATAASKQAAAPAAKKPATTTAAKKAAAPAAKKPATTTSEKTAGTPAKKAAAPRKRSAARKRR